MKEVETGGPSPTIFKRQLTPSAKLYLHWDERPTDERWKQHKNVFLCLTIAGKPVFCSHGDPLHQSTDAGALATIYATLGTYEDGLRHFITRNRVFVFHKIGPLLFVCSSVRRPLYVIRRQLQLFAIGLVALLTPALLSKIEQDSRYDPCVALSGSEPLLNTLLNTARHSSCVQLSDLNTLYLEPKIRSTITKTVASVCGGYPGIHMVVICVGLQVITVMTRNNVVLSPDEVNVMLCMLSQQPFHAGRIFLPLFLKSYSSKRYIFILAEEFVPGVTIAIGVHNITDRTQGEKAMSELWARFDAIKIDQTSDVRRLDILVEQYNAVESLASDQEKPTKPPFPSVVFKVIPEDQALSPKVKRQRGEQRSYLDLLEQIAKVPFLTMSQIGIREVKHFIYRAIGSHIQLTPIFEYPYLTCAEGRRLTNLYFSISDEMKSINTSGASRRVLESQERQTRSTDQYNQAPADFVFRPYNINEANTAVAAVETKYEKIIAWCSNDFELYMTLSSEIAIDRAVQLSKQLMAWIECHREAITGFVRDMLL